MTDTYHDALFIGGAFARPAGTTSMDIRSPATGEVVGRCPEAEPADVDRAVAAAREAFDHGAWPRQSLQERADALRRLASALKPRGAELDALVPRESGIPAVFASGSSSFPLLDYYADLADDVVLEDLRPGRAGATGPAVVRRVPAGVVAGIVPWNGPVMQILMKLAPALLAGCAIVVKTAPETPLSSYPLAQAIEAAGLPPGVVSIINGGRAVGEALVGHPGVDQVSFTGSTRTGEHVAATCGARLARVSLELGGKSAAILLEDADLDVAVPTATQFGLFFNGEACSALTRVLAPRHLYDDVVDRVVGVVGAMVVGDPTDPATFIGPLITERQRALVEDYIALGRAEGARVVYGGGRPAGLDAGWYVEPTVFADVENGMRIAQEEIFGPVLAVIPYDGIDDAVRISNDSVFGLAGAVFGPDNDVCLDVARRLRTGHVGINCQGQDWVFPFGGFGRSGMGREMGTEGLELYQDLQTFGLPLGAPEPRLATA
jgi:betaine-aldehyde dehydrogenase